MDVARAAKRQPGVKNVRLVYRRDRRNMPADEDELVMALEDGVEFKELLAPEGLEGGRLKCEVCSLGEPDESGRRSPVGTGEFTEVPATAVICAVGETVFTEIYESAGAELDAKGHPVLDENMMTTVKGLYAAGDITCGRYVNDRLHKTEVINDYSWAVAGGFMAANHMIGKTQ